MSMVGFKANQIEQVPAAALPPQLRWLILPITVSATCRMNSANGRCCKISCWPVIAGATAGEPSQCHNLELLRIAANRLTQLPQWLLTLPSLTWLAYAGNPVESAVELAIDDNTANIPWAELELAEVLGEGASGVIRKALRKPSNEPVAVKLYKGTITSDGSPLHEMQACIAAGLHPNLIKVEGRVIGHPDNQAALVMDLIDPSYRNLADLPSLASCTRDVYDPATRFSVAVAFAHGARHRLRGRTSPHGITHGDLYGHNILWNAGGDCLLGDFGAASSHATADTLETRRCSALKCGRSGCC